MNYEDLRGDLKELRGMVKYCLEELKKSVEEEAEECKKKKA